jgi:uncharacterized membrane protein
VDPKAVSESLIRWLHLIAGILWIGHLWFFNFVNANFAPTLDADSKKKVVPELMPRALYFFRWGAAFTWLTGFLLLGLVFYMQGFGNTLDSKMEGTPSGGTYLCIALTFGAVFIYDFLASGPLKDPTKMFWAGWILSAVMYLVFHHVGGMGFRGASIHLGAMWGTMMAFNVWFRIWPNQRQIIRGVQTGEAAPAEVVALAGLRSKHNTYMSFPLMFMMLNAHNTWAATGEAGKFAVSDLYVPVVVLVAFLLSYHVYELAKKEGPKFF